MTNYELAGGIATIISSYRKNELRKPLDREHVLKWVNQFDEKDRNVVLQETFHILTEQYYSCEDVYNELDKVINVILKRYGTFDNVVFTNTQECGSSQRVLYKILEEKLKEKMKFQNENFSDSNRIYVYVDDGLYTGCRAQRDISNLLAFLPVRSTLHVFYLFAYSDSFCYRKQKLKELALKKGIKLYFTTNRMFYNDRNSHAKSIDFVWPSKEARRNSEVDEYEQKLRMTGKTWWMYYNLNVYHNEGGMFSTFESGKVVSEIFLKYGLKICNRLKNDTFRPLGMSGALNFGLGTFVVTDFNISNTAPLVLWWGSFEETDDPIGCWYPLLPRRNNKEFYQLIEKQRKQVSLQEAIPVLKTVYGLSKDEYKKRTKTSENQTDIKGILSLADIEICNDDSELFRYLFALDFEMIKIVQTVVYIGRDYIWNQQAEWNEMREDGMEVEPLSFPVNNPDEVLYEWMNYLGEGNKWISKEVEAEVIYNKSGCLHKYLERAFTILGI